MHGAWAETGRYLSACGDDEPTLLDIEQPTGGSRLEFRVNRDVIALNNLTNGNAWLVDSDLRLVDNWEEVTPPEESEEEEGEEKSSQQTFEDTLAERTDQNRPPLARDDEYGVRPGRTTILEVLENDTDPDGDVLTVASATEVSEASGRLELIDGGRALQFSPAEGCGGLGVVPVLRRRRPGRRRRGIRQRAHRARDPRTPRRSRCARGAVSVEQGQQISLQRARRLERPRRRRPLPRERVADRRRLGAVQPRRLPHVRAQVRPSSGSKEVKFTRLRRAGDRGGHARRST